jgi:hypothetical protein
MLEIKKLTTAEDLKNLKGKEILLIKWKKDFFWQHGICLYPNWKLDTTTLTITKHVYILPSLFGQGRSWAEEIYSIEDVETPSVTPVGGAQ